MGRKFTRETDTGEIYLLPDEKQALKNIPSFLNETTEEREDISEAYERNNSIFDLQKQLRNKDRQLKKATRNKVVLDNNILIAGFIVLGIIVVLSVVVAVLIINNNKPLPAATVSDSIVVETSDVSYSSYANNTASETKNQDNVASNEPYSHSDEQAFVSESTVDNNSPNAQAKWNLWGLFHSKNAQPFVNAVSTLVGWSIGAFLFSKVRRWLRP